MQLDHHHMAVAIHEASQARQRISLLRTRLSILSERQMAVTLFRTANVQLKKAVLRQRSPSFGTSSQRKQKAKTAGLTMMRAQACTLADSGRAAREHRHWQAIWMRQLANLKLLAVLYQHKEALCLGKGDMPESGRWQGANVHRHKVHQTGADPVKPSRVLRSRGPQLLWRRKRRRNSETAV